MPTRAPPECKKPGRKVTRAGKTNNQAENLPVYEPNTQEPMCRAELIKYWINLSLDERTANKLLWVTEGGTKVKRLTEEVCPYLDNPDRFECSPQVLCKEVIWGTRGYWEVEYSGWVVVGVTYEGLGRKANTGSCGLGENEESWGLCWAGSCYHAWFNGLNKEIRGFPRCSTIGVYVDQPAGIINFYLVEGGEDGERKEVQLLHRIEAPIKDRILPGFWVGLKSSFTTLKKE